ncbi:M20/M25/M40 family metallo-hydrolase [Erythrobacter neustonensis]|uniref:Peptidase M28 n=1 Tax=Erythrobacter neustonensis TaxID=1112 RepID=A0A192D6C2_9SPHN|nr:M20/M25/M40 family metallo-hydrolase [Erythrobacter neustonensis]ANK13581.1 peptidase M28 [Erythrobacter neustonensis]
MVKRFLLLAAAVSAPLAAQTHPADSVSADRLEKDVEKLVSFGTRHTLSSQTDPRRGIGAAVDWGLAEFKRIGAKCGGCLEVLPVGETVTGPRVPTPTLVRNAVAIQRGTQRPNEVVIVQGHIDSRVSDVMDATSDAPGANDDGSGTALVIEAARMLSGQKYPTTIIYALLSGEEQGLHGGQILANWAERQGFTVKAVLNNDIVGNSCGSDGYCEPKVVRVFSEGPRADFTEKLRASATRFGGENDTPSRNLSRWVAALSAKHPDGLQVRQIWRTDRMGRGGDQVPFLQKGYPAIRFSVGVEDYDHQHQDLRTENGIKFGDTIEEMDFGYLAGVTKLNVRALDALARAPMPPKVSVDAAVRTDTELAWQAVPGAQVYAVATRATDAPAWGEDVALVYVDGPMSEMTTERKFTHIRKLRGDDWMFGVAACADTYCSPVSSAVPGGAFEPVAKE